VGAAEVASKDVVTAALGASAALAGFILVFLGIVITSLSSFPAETTRVVRRPYLWIAGLALGAFALSLATVALGFAWLAYGQATDLYSWLTWLFIAELGLVMVVGVIATRQAVGR
jgi:uncharacterized membrane protein